MLSKNILKGTVGVILRDPSFKVSLPIHNGTLQIYVCLKINEISLFFSSKSDYFQMWLLLRSYLPIYTAETMEEIARIKLALRLKNEDFFLVGYTNRG